MFAHYSVEMILMGAWEVAKKRDLEKSPLALC